jgi:hypothetical protein
MHSIRCKLYPNYLPATGGPFIARTDSEAALSIEQICAAIKNSGELKGSYPELVAHSKQFLDKIVHKLCDGFSVNLGYFTIHPNVGGTFYSKNEQYNREKHPINFRFRPSGMMSRLTEDISVVVDGLADCAGYIDKYRDVKNDTENSIFVPGGQFCIYGHKIKILGDSPDIGLFFVPVEDPSKAVRVEQIAENMPSKIIGVAPDTKFKMNRIEIRTRFTGSGNTLLKSTRVITSDFVIESV